MGGSIGTGDDIAQIFGSMGHSGRASAHGGGVLCFGMGITFRGAALV